MRFQNAKSPFFFCFALILLLPRLTRAEDADLSQRLLALTKQMQVQLAEATKQGLIEVASGQPAGRLQSLRLADRNDGG